MSYYDLGGATLAYLKIGSLEVKAQKLDISREPIWSSNTGRTSSGKMVGDIVAQKYKLTITLPPMSDEQAASFDAAILPAFFNVTFRNPTTGKNVTKSMYAGSPRYPVYSYVDIYPRYVGTAVELIEQ